MAAQLLDTLRWQFRLTWQLAQYHLPQLTDEACLWEPAPDSWTVREAGGVWRPDWADAEPDPVPPVTIGWLTWHIIWWWSGLIAAVRDEPRVEREDVLWPGSAKAAVEQVEALSAAWRLSQRCSSSTRYSTHLPNCARTVRRLETAANRLILRVSPIPLFVIARFMRATNFFLDEKNGWPGQAGHDDRDHNHKGITP